MNKRFGQIIMCVVIALVLCIYILIPPSLAVSTSVPVLSNPTALYRVLSNDAKWPRWWPDSAGNHSGENNALTYNGYTFKLANRQEGLVGVDISKGDFRMTSTIQVLSMGFDSTLILWKSSPIRSRPNPLTRFLNYRKVEDISMGMKQVLKNFKDFADSAQNVYDWPIYKTTTLDTFLLSARFTSSVYPSTADIYGYLDVVKKEILRQKGLPISSPLLDVKKLKTDSFETQVAIPTNIKLKDNGKIFYNRMEPGNFAAVEVKGGVHTVEEAIKQVQFYITDYGKTQMAKGFQILETDRSQEPDTSKWLTKIYIPIVK